MIRKVKWLEEKKGFGFITVEGGGDDVFVHYSGIEGTGHRNLAEGEYIEFEVEMSAKGPKAVKVRRLAQA